jgi:photosynthetic reaction center H subunit
MPIGAITGYMDVAQMVLYGFWIFFFGLVFYLRREDKREGYPLESDRGRMSPRIKVVGWPRPPEPKTFLLPLDQGVRFTPPPVKPPKPVSGARPLAPWPGAPLVPTENPMFAAVGPGTYPEREDLPDLSFFGGPKIMPMRLSKGYHVESNDPDPHGFKVVAADGEVAGTVKDLWIDLAEHRILYYEIELTNRDPEDTRPNPLLPYGFVTVKFNRGELRVVSITAEQFHDVPRTASPEQVTRLEEDRICSYYASGLLYAKPSRQEPLI